MCIYIHHLFQIKTIYLLYIQVKLLLTNVYMDKLCMQGKCLNLGDQIQLFEKTIKVDLSRHFESPEKIAEYLSKSIFVISIGSNDYINNYLEPGIYDTSRRYTPQAFAKLLNDNLFQQLQVPFLYILL